jgi:disulfide bond formation protein DsbB
MPVKPANYERDDANRPIPALNGFRWSARPFRLDYPRLLREFRHHFRRRAEVVRHDARGIGGQPCGQGDFLIRAAWLGPWATGRCPHLPRNLPHHRPNPHKRYLCSYPRLSLKRRNTFFCHRSIVTTGGREPPSLRKLLSCRKGQILTMSPSAASDHELSRTSPSPSAISLNLIWPSLLVALLALAGSLWLSIGMKLKACPLCFYQRTFVMGVVAVLGTGLLTGQRYRAVLNLLALPLAVAGFGVAVFHEYLELSDKLECPAGVMGIGTTPQQSLAALVVLLAVIAVGVVQSGKVGETHSPAVGAAIVLGLLLALGAVASSPPMPLAPTQAYSSPLDICRPPFRQK